MKNRKIIFHDDSMLSKRLDENFHFQHALRHCLQIYKSNSIYTFIPKNLSTSMRSSIAIENKFINFDTKSLSWIDKNNGAFKPSLKDLFNSAFTFVILRNPFERLYSFFCDFVSKNNPKIDMMIKKILNNKLTDLSFEEFIKLLDGDLIHRNHHWSPQKFFLIFENYDLYVPFEKFQEYSNKIERYANIKIYDTRSLRPPFGLGKLKKLKDNYYGNFTGNKINSLIKIGKVPCVKSMFNNDLINLVNKLFQDDILLYKNQFNIDPLDIFN